MTFVCLVLAWGCSETLDKDLANHECNAQGECLEGYVCSIDNLCVHEDELRDASTGTSLDAGRPAQPPKPTQRARDPATSRVRADVSTPTKIVAPPMNTGMDGIAGTSAGSAGTAGASGMPEIVAGASAAGTTANAGTGTAGTAASAGTGAMSAPAPAGTGAASAPAAAGTGAAGTPAMPSAPAGAPAQPPVAGAPAPACEEGRTQCGDRCVNLSRNEDHCGKCGNACDDDESCESGRCREQDDDRGGGNGRGRN